MTKKIMILTILILTGVLIILINLDSKDIKRSYFLKTGDFTEGTGASDSTPNPQIIITSEAIKKLQDRLPYSTDKFVISKFDYKTARFYVELNYKTTTNKIEFLNWLKTSSFSSIPQNRFEVRQI